MISNIQYAIDPYW